MTTVKEFKKWLDRLPDEAIIKVVRQEPSRDYESYGECILVDLELNESNIGAGYEFIDYTNNKFVRKSHPCFGLKILILGEK